MISRLLCVFVCLLFVLLFCVVVVFVFLFGCCFGGFVCVCVCCVCWGGGGGGVNASPQVSPFPSREEPRAIRDDGLRCDWLQQRVTPHDLKHALSFTRVLPWQRSTRGVTLSSRTEPLDENIHLDCRMAVAWLAAVSWLCRVALILMSAAAVLVAGGQKWWTTRSLGLLFPTTAERASCRGRVQVALAGWPLPPS